jgi:uncharacterized cupin superfamily protein
VPEAQLERIESGLVPVDQGWFVVNAADAAWDDNDRYGSSCPFDGFDRDRSFPQLGVNLRVLMPGQPNGNYHAEDVQEDFLVLAGECVLLIEEQERRLRAWDFVHCPPGTRHIFVGAGDRPCVILMTGARRRGHEIMYPVSELALRHAAGVEVETNSPPQAYADAPPDRFARPACWDELPWARP